MLLLSRSISIHTLRTEGDAHRAGDALPKDISIHTLRTEGDTARR